MHYHLVLTDAQGKAVDVRATASRADAEQETRRILVDQPDWSPTRYPGRTWRRGEVEFYVDRATAVRRELSVMRCGAKHDVPDLACVLRTLAIPALNLHAPVGSPDLLAPHDGRGAQGQRR